MDNKTNKMLIDATHPEETRVVVLRNGRVEEFDFESATRRPLRGNIYLAKVTRVEPSLQAAFVEYGGNRHGFLAFAEIHPDYYQIPYADRQALLDEEVAAELEADQEADERAERMAGGRNQGQGRRNSHGNRGSGARHSGDVDQPDQGGAQHSDGEGAFDASAQDAVEAASQADQGHEQNATADTPDDQSHDRHTDTGHGERGHDHHGHSRAGHSDRGESEAISKAAPSEPQTRVEDAGLKDHDVRTAEPAEPAASLDPHPHDYGHQGHPDHTHTADNDGSHVEEIPVSPDDGEPEVVSGGDDQLSNTEQTEEFQERPRRQRRRHYKIQEVIKRRQIMLVQVVKEERGTKGAALTTYLSLAGRYTVLMPNTGRGGGISRKITQAQDRKRLKAIAEDLDVPDGMGLIVRTAGASRTLPEIRRDYEYLMRLWESVRDLTLSSTAPSLVYEEGSLIKRSIRDQYTKEIDEIIVAGAEAHREAQDFMRMLMPSHARNVILHDRPEPLFVRYPAVDRQLNAMFSPYVPLKSGGYLVINQTEALVAIDINSGKSTREFNIEDTALNTNLEAADEIARQLKLRDLAGLIVIDFIDMEEKRNNRNVERRMKDALRFDRARIQVGRISHFGLLEMSRQRMRTGVLEGSTTQCAHCQGTGIIRSVESVSLAVLRGLEDHLQRDARSSVNVMANAEVALYILNHKRPFIAEMERRYGIAVAVLSSDKMHGANFAVERSAAPLPPRRQPERAAVTMNSGFSGDDAMETFDEADDPRPSSPVIETDIESIDTDEAIDDDRDHRADDNRNERGSERGNDHGTGRSGDRGGDADSKRKRRRRGRGRGREDERGGDRDGQRQPRHGVNAGNPSVDTQHADNDEHAVSRDASGGNFADTDFDHPAHHQGDENGAAGIAHGARVDDAPELPNGDGIVAQADNAPRADGDDDKGDGRRRRRRGRRGGRKGGRDDAGSDGTVDHADTQADVTDRDGAPDEEIAAVQQPAPAASAHREPKSVPSGAAPELPQAELAMTKPEKTVLMAEAAATPQLVAAITEPLAPPAARPIATEPEIVSDAPARPARRGWWKTRMLGQ